MMKKRYSGRKYGRRLRKNAAALLTAAVTAFAFVPEAAVVYATESTETEGSEEPVFEDTDAAEEKTGEDAAESAGDGRDASESDAEEAETAQKETAAEGDQEGAGETENAEGLKEDAGESGNAEDLKENAGEAGNAEGLKEDAGESGNAEDLKEGAGEAGNAEDLKENAGEAVNAEGLKENAGEAVNAEGLKEAADMEKTVSENAAEPLHVKEPLGKELPAEESEEEEEEAVYDGIRIDGSFADWEAISKTDAGGSSEYQDFLKAVAVVQEDDYIYVYIRDTGIGAAAWSGPHGNGQFSIVTDLGYSVLFQLHAQNNGAAVSISGVDGAECAYHTKGWGYDGEWEVSIPLSELPHNRGSYAFGYYQAEPFIGEIADKREKDDVTGEVSEGTEKKADVFDGIGYDGLYGDWNSYPHTLIQYATSGTHEKYVDGEGALYADGDTLYGHVVTRMAAHLTEHGEEMQYGVVLRINQDDDYWFEFRLVDVDAAGNINWNVNVADQENGTHEYYIVDTRGWSNAASLSDITRGNNVYGKIRITKSDISDEAEWKLDLGLLADHFGLEETDMQVLEVKYERIGDRWLQTAGASTGPAAGILLSMAVAGTAAAVLRRKKDTEAVSGCFGTGILTWPDTKKIRFTEGNE